MDPLELGRIASTGLAVVATWLRLWTPLPHFDAVGFAVVLIGGYPTFREAAADLLSRRMTMELSMTIALASALAIREFFTALVIVFFVLIAEVLEELTVGRGRGSLHQRQRPEVTQQTAMLASLMRRVRGIQAVRLRGDRGARHQQDHRQLRPEWHPSCQSAPLHRKPGNSRLPVG